MIYFIYTSYDILILKKLEKQELHIEKKTYIRQKL